MLFLLQDQISQHSHNNFRLYMSWQMGFIQMGEESLFIQPAVVHDPSLSFSGLKHQLLRQSLSAKTKSGLDFKQSNYCGAVQGEWHIETE